MHQQIRQSLEDFLRGRHHRELPAEFQAHLGECPECADELRLLQEHSELLRSLGSGVLGSGAEEVEPRPGFYARVVERIQAQPISIWSVFLERKFGFRLAVASAALMALLATYLITSEANGPEFISRPGVASDLPHTGAATTAASGASATSEEGQQERDAVLVDLASYHP